MRKVLALMLAVTLAACGSTAQTPTTASTAPIRPFTTTTLLGPTTPPTTVAPTSTSRAGPTAYDQLANFVGAAERMDQQLRRAAEQVNGAGPPWTSPLPAGVAASVDAADLQSVAAAIPNGLPGEVLRRTILVYSDLASRRYAMRWFGTEGFPYVEPNPQMQSELNAALANGASAARRFASDLDGLVNTARGLPPVAPAAPTSLEAANRLLLIQWTNMINGGCASTGGTVITTLPTILWRPHDDASGTIAGVDFEARPANGTWQVTIRAC